MKFTDSSERRKVAKRRQKQQRELEAQGIIARPGIPWFPKKERK